MLISAARLGTFAIQSADGFLGTVDDLFFDNVTWAVRYMALRTGRCVNDRRVLIPPVFGIDAKRTSDHRGELMTSKPVAEHTGKSAFNANPRQQYAANIGYDNFFPYYGSPSPGLPEVPTENVTPSPSAFPHKATGSNGHLENSHLRSTDGMSGYEVEAPDGSVGQVDGFVVEDEPWAIRYIIVATKSLKPARKALLSPAWIKQVSWTAAKVYLDLSRDLVQTAPEYIESEPVTRNYEDQLYSYYGCLPYWPQPAFVRSR